MTTFEQFCPPATLAADNAYRHLERLLNSGVDFTQISVISGLAESDLRSFLNENPSKVTFAFADALYNVTTGDRPLYKATDSHRASLILDKLAQEQECSLEEAAEKLGVEDCQLNCILEGKPITWGTWERVAERSKKRGIRLSSLSEA